jgi:NADH dehydrogenase FAD-containing subunit
MNLVLVGGGVAGHLLARRLAPRPLTLVDPRDHLLVPMAAPRFLVEPTHAGRALVPFSDFLPHVSHIRGRVVRVAERHLELHTGAIVPFDTVVFALGASQTDPAMTSADRRIDQLSAVAQRASDLRTAGTILIVGGGPVGVETAGELAEHGFGGRCILAGGSERLLPSADPRAGLAAERYLRARGIDVRLGVRYRISETPGPGTATGTDGATLPYDLVIRATGGQPATTFLHEHGVLNDRGEIRVDAAFRVVGRQGWYAIGDCTDVPEPKLGRWAAHQAEALGKAWNAGAEARYAPHTGHRGLVVTLGRGHAVGEIPGLPMFLVSPIGRWVKGRDLLVARYRRRVGLR